MERDTIFISHATPEDNDFTIWLASRLEMLGYKVWIDKEKLIGGETFWKEIDNAIRHESQKFLLVYSSNICYRREAGNLKQGIYNELELAKSIANDNGLNDFIIPLKVDDSPHNLFVGANVLNHIDFKDMWGTGLDFLVKKLERDNISKSNTKSVTFQDWFETQYTNSNGIIAREEYYISSMWNFKILPDKFFLHQYQNKKQAEAIVNEFEFPFSIIANVIATFSKELPSEFLVDGKQVSIRPKSVFTVSLSDIIYGNNSVSFPTTRDMINHFKSLISSTLHSVFTQRGLEKYSFSGKKTAYFYIPGILENDKVKFIFPKNEKSKIKKVLGKYFEEQWHFGLSIKPRVNPNFSLSIYNHLIFTKNGHQVLRNRKKIQSYRRKKGKTMFNEQWRDLVLAFIQGLKVDDEIKIRVNESQFLEMEEYPVIIDSSFGYIEPKI